jgi:hypothetical protein
MIKIKCSLALCAFFVLSASGVGHAEERTINAYAPWEGRGQIYPTGEDQVTFVGAFSGVMFVERDGNVVNSGNIMCPGMIKIDLRDGSQTGQGQCTLSNDDGERIYAEWICSGTHFVGCDGKFKLIAGTGEYSGVTGEGDFLMRSGLQAIAISSAGNVVERAATGLAIWRNFHYKMPR